MSLKNNLTDAIRSLTDLRSSVKEQIRVIEKDDRFTQEHKDQLIQDAKAAFTVSADAVASNARAQIDQARKGFQQSQGAITKNRLSPDRAQAFQAAIRMIELGGKILSAGDLRELAEPFEDDRIALAAIRGLVEREGLNGEQLPFIGDKNPDGPLDMAWGTINKVASKPLDADIGLEVAVEIAHIEQMPASVFEAVANT